MKKSDSTNTLEDTLDLPETHNIESSNQFTEKLDKDNLQSESDYTPLTPPTPNKIKKRSRISSAFRSLRGNKSSSKKDKTQSDFDVEFITSGEEQETELLNQTKNIKTIKKTQSLSPELTKKKSKISTKLSSLTSIKKYRINPKKSHSDLTEDNLVTISTQTSGTLKRRTIIQDTKNLSISQTSLLDLPDSDEGGVGGGDNEIKTIIKEDKKNSTENLLTSFEENSTPVKFDKVKKIQITIQGKKIERITTNNNRNLPTTTTSLSEDEDYLTATTTTPIIQSPTTTVTQEELQSEQINKLLSSSSRTLVVDKQSTSTVVDTNSSTNKRSSRKKTKIPTANKTTAGSNIHKHHSSTASVIEAIEYSPVIITQSVLDKPPKERAPNLPSRTVEKNLITSKGAIRKSQVKLKRQEEHEDQSDSGNFMIDKDKSSSLERGRRYPRGPKPIEDDDKLIGSSEQIKESVSDIIAFSGNNLQNPNLSGSIAPDSFKISKQGSENIATVIERKPKIHFSVGTPVRPQQTTLLDIQSTREIKDISSLSSNKSSDSQSPISEGSATLRRIRYNPQPTFYTDEERELLEGKRETYLSGISEYSLESVDSQMPAFGDLTMDHEEVPIMTSSSGEKREHLYKILVIGELGTGKTSFIKRYVHQFFSQNYRATIGVDFALKVLHWDSNTIIRLQLWDIAGQERFGNMTRVYYKEAVGAFIVFDVTRSGTFECVSKWKEDLDSKVQLPDGSPIPCILLANKCDQEKQGVITNTEKMDEYVKDNGFAGWFETSAKENVNIDEAARALVNKILLNDKLISAADIIDSEKFNVNGISEGKKNNCSC